MPAPGPRWAQDLYECTFTPRINRPSAGSQPDGRVPLHLRTKAIQECKQDVRGLISDLLDRNHGYPTISNLGICGKR